MKEYQIKPIQDVKHGSLVRVPTIGGYDYVIVDRRKLHSALMHTKDNKHVYHGVLMECYLVGDDKLLLVPIDMHVEVVRDDTEYCETTSKYLERNK